MTRSPQQDPLVLAVSQARSDLSREISEIRKDITDFRSLISTDLADIKHAEGDHFHQLLEKVKQQSESKLLKAAYIALPVVLGFLVWALQLNTNQRIDSTSKELATRLAMTEEFYKKQLAIYEEADAKMASILEKLKDLGANPGDRGHRSEAADEVRGLSDLVKTKKIFFSAEVRDALEDVTIMAAGMTDPHPTSNVPTLAGKIADVEKIMTAELEGKMWPLHQQP